MSTGTPSFQIKMQQNIQVSRVLVSFCLEAEETVILHSVPGNITSWDMTSFDLTS